MEHSASDIQHLKDAYFTARNKYKPQSIKIIFVAEAPPCALDRFFYFEEVKTQDSLFLEIMGVLYPDQKERYLASGRESTLKQDLLLRFKYDGYWLLDLCETPTSISGSPSSAEVQSLLKRLAKFKDDNITIILIKASVYDSCYDVLKTAGYRVVDERLPFPGSGQQRVFREKFKRALQMCG